MIEAAAEAFERWGLAVGDQVELRADDERGDAMTEPDAGRAAE